MSQLKSQLAHNCTHSIYAQPPPVRANRIICTIGPKTQTVEALKQLIKSGMDVVRMNFSHGSYEFHQTTIDNARKAAAELKVTIGIALDTKGPEIRSGMTEDPNGFRINVGDRIRVSTDKKYET